MTWLTPMVGSVAAAIAVPTLLILYFLKLRRRELEVSTTLLWKKAVQDLQANAPFQKLRRNLLLFLQLLILAAALVGVAQPQWKAKQGPGEKSVIMIDRSASMSALDMGEAGKEVPRLEAAKKSAAAFIDALPAGGLFESAGAGEAMVISFDSSAEVVQTFTANKSLLKQAVASITASDAASSIDEAMRLATAYVGPKVVENVGMQPGAPLFIWSDGGIPDLEKVRLHPETRLEYYSVGKKETHNTAITALRAERAYDKPGEVAVFVGLQTTEPSGKSVDVELAVDGNRVAAKSVKMPAPRNPGETSTGGVVFKLDRSERTLITAKLAQPDALEADNTARIVVPPAKRLAVAIVSPGNMFLEAGIGGLPLSKADRMTPAEFAALVDQGQTSKYDVFIMDRVDPTAPVAGSGKKDDKGAAVMPPGRYLMFGVLPSGLRGITTDEHKGEPQADVVADWNRDHPALRLTAFDSLIVAKPMAVKLDDNIRVLVRGTTGPLIVESIQDATHAIVVCFDVLESNWPFDVGYVLFLASAIGYLGEDQAESAGSRVNVGEMLSAALPAGVTESELELPGDGGTARLQTGPDGRAGYGPIRKVGLYTLKWNGPPGPSDLSEDGRSLRAFGVNLFDPKESVIEAKDKLELPSKAVVSADGKKGGGASGQQRLWPWLLIGAIVIVLLEWFVYNRKTYL